MGKNEKSYLKFAKEKEEKLCTSEKQKMRQDESLIATNFPDIFGFLSSTLGISF